MHMTQKCYNMKNIDFHIIILFLSESEWKIGAKMYYFYNMKMKFSNRCKNTTFRETLHFYNFFSFKHATLQIFIFAPLFKKWVLTNIYILKYVWVKYRNLCFFFLTFWGFELMTFWLLDWCLNHLAIVT